MSSLFLIVRGREEEVGWMPIEEDLLTFSANWTAAGSVQDLILCGREARAGASEGLKKAAFHRPETSGNIP